MKYLIAYLIVGFCWAPYAVKKHLEFDYPRKMLPFTWSLNLLLWPLCMLLFAVRKDLP